MSFVLTRIWDIHIELCFNLDTTFFKLDLTRKFESGPLFADICRTVLDFRVIFTVKITKGYLISDYFHFIRKEKVPLFRTSQFKKVWKNQSCGKVELLAHLTATLKNPASFPTQK